ncbi:hypothetical protein O1L60_27390 [Streptomyces diastatochromogenes]|nr:hypothetical protein [Streptomyces diastatochromogenes]
MTTADENRDDHVSLDGVSLALGDGTRVTRAAKPLGTGGQGSVWRLNERDDLAAKIYNRVPDGAQLRRLTAMLRADPLAGERLAPGQPPMLVWPVDLIEAGGSPVGYGMPYLDPAAHTQLSGLLQKPVRLRRFGGRAHWKFLLAVASNLAYMTAELHQQGFVVGDLSSANAVVDRNGFVTFLDCDSFAFTDTLTGESFGCEVFTDDYASPERQRGAADPARGRLRPGRPRLPAAHRREPPLRRGSAVRRGGGDPQGQHRERHLVPGRPGPGAGAGSAAGARGAAAPAGGAGAADLRSGDARSPAPAVVGGLAGRAGRGAGGGRAVRGRAGPPLRRSSDGVPVVRAPVGRTAGPVRVGPGAELRCGRGRGGLGEYEAVGVRRGGPVPCPGAKQSASGTAGPSPTPGAKQSASGTAGPSPTPGASAGVPRPRRRRPAPRPRGTGPPPPGRSRCPRGRSRWAAGPC